MALWQGKSRGGVTGHKVFVFIIKNLGTSFAYFFLKIIAVYYFFSFGKPFMSSYFYFNKIHCYNKIKSLLYIYKSYCMLGKVLVDKVALLSDVGKQFLRNYDNDHIIKELIDGNTGGIIINAHVGNWEIAGQLLEYFDTKINILMFDSEHQRIRNYLSNVLADKNVNFIIINDGIGHLQQIEKALKNKELIAMNGDRFLAGNLTVSCNFLGHDAKFPLSPYYIAGKYNVPVVYAFAMKEGKNFYRFFATPKRYIENFYSMKKREQGLKDAVNDYAAALEKIVCKYPLQWFNYYNFWSKTE